MAADRDGFTRTDVHRRAVDQRSAPGDREIPCAQSAAGRHVDVEVAVGHLDLVTAVEAGSAAGIPGRVDLIEIGMEGAVLARVVDPLRVGDDHDAVDGNARRLLRGVAFRLRVVDRLPLRVRRLVRCGVGGTCIGRGRRSLGPRRRLPFCVSQSRRVLAEQIPTAVLGNEPAVKWIDDEILGVRKATTGICSGG